MLAAEGQSSSAPSAAVDRATAAASAVAGNYDLLAEILLRLPHKPLARAKSVSKHWCSLISSPYFSLRQNPSPNSPAGLLLHHDRTDEIFFGEASSGIPKVRYISLDNNENQASDSSLQFLLAFFNENPKVDILSSCNGLLCCCDSELLNCFVVNPTTKQFRNIKLPHLELSHMIRLGVSLAFDPSRSTHYKVVCVLFSIQSAPHYHIAIYSSETHTWRPSGDAFTAPYGIEFSRGVFWNGAVNWVSQCRPTKSVYPSMPRGDSLYFNVDQERLQSMPMPPLRGGSQANLKVWLFGESRNHLHLIESKDSLVVEELKIYEMERDYSGWFVRYSVAVHEVGGAFPQSLLGLFRTYWVLRREKDDESLLMLQRHIRDNFICYNLKGKTIKKVLNPEGGALILFGHFNVYPYFESLASV